MHLVALLLTFVSVLAAEQNSPTRVRVVVPLDTTAAFDQALSEVVRQFNSSQSGYRVELTRRGTPFQNLRSIIASHYAGDLPDLVLINEADVQTLTNLNIVAPLSSQWVNGKKFLPKLTSKLKCQDQPCSAPFQRRVAAWYFNRELLFKLNQETERIPTNWNALAALSVKLHKPGEIWGLSIPGTGELVIPRWNAFGYSTVLSPAEASAELAQKFWTTKANWVPGNPTIEEASRRFLDQKAVVLLGSIEQMAYLKANAAFKLGSALPEGELSWFGTDFVLLTKTEKTAIGAREFLDYLYRPQNSLTLFKASATLPITQAQASDAGWKKELDQNTLVKAAGSRKLKNSSLEKIPPQIREEWASEVWKAVEQDIPAEERASKSVELRNRLQKLLSTNPR